MEIDQSLIMQFGLMNKLSTGHALLDTLLVMLVPFIVNPLFPHIREMFNNFWAQMRHKPSGKEHERIITYKKKDGYYNYDSDQTPNHKLQQAIMIHLNTLPDVFSQLVTADVCLAKAKRSHAAASAASDDSENDESTEASDGTDWYPGIELEGFEVKLVPPLDTWINVNPGLRFMRSEQLITRDKENEEVTTYTLLGKTSHVVDEFIEAAYDSYRIMLKGEQKDKKADRYLYLPMLAGEDPNHITYRRYKLSDEKSFANFFHPEKQPLLTLVDNFNQKKGKFEIQGYPQKLGFLLHGPPGTGKTTFIKALATHTRRSIINIPLSRIKTNQQLMDMMMDEKIKVEGEDMRVPLPFNRVIYVMEDIDAASHVVQKRATVNEHAALAHALAAHPAKLDNKFKDEHKLTTATTTTTTATAVKVMDGDANGASARDDAGGRVVEVMTRTRSITHEAQDTRCMIEEVITDAVVSPSGPVQGPKGPSAAWLTMQGLAGVSAASGSDALNLAGLLNVLDGVVDTPGRIVVMSTNHPEKLDPALIRPGRINRQVYLGYIAAAEAVMMVQHYFGGLSTQQQQQLTSSWVHNAVTPATLEALCAEFDEVDDLLAAIKHLTAPSAAAVGASSAEECQSLLSAASAVSLKQRSSSSESGVSHCAMSTDTAASTADSALAAASPADSPFAAAAMNGTEKGE